VTPQKSSDNMMVHAVFAIMAAVFLFQAFAWRALFADGAYFLVYIIEHHSFFAANESTRLFNYVITQLPAVLAVRAGVTNLTFLITLFSSWMLALPLLFWGLALVKLRDDVLFWPFVAFFTAVYFNVNFFIVGEYNLTYALVGCCVALMLREKPLHGGDHVWLAIAAILLTMSYALTMLMGPILAYLAWRHMKSAVDPRQRLFWRLLIVMFVLSACVGFYGYLFPDLPGNKTRAMNIVALLVDHQLLFTLLFVVMVSVTFMIRSKLWQDQFFLVLLALLAVNCIGIFRPSPGLAFATRAFVGLGVVGGAILLIIARCQPMVRAWLERIVPQCPKNYAVVPIFILFCELAFFDIRGSLAYRAYLQDFSKLVNKESGFLAFTAASTTLPDDGLYSWCWTYPSVSLLLRKNTDGAIVLNPDNCVQAEFFHPRQYLPDLSRYYRS
jgi:hypothetical protein